MYYYLLTTLIVLTSAQAFAQPATNKTGIVNDLQSKAKSESVLSTVIPQPSCPLKIERANLRIVDGHFVTLYQIRNEGHKTVKGYTIARWFTDNTGDVMTGTLPRGNNEFKKGTTATSAEDQNVPRSSPDTPQNQTIINRIAFFFVVEVLYEDGSRFSDLETLNSLKNHLEYFETAYERFDKELENPVKP